MESLVSMWSQNVLRSNGNSFAIVCTQLCSWNHMETKDLHRDVTYNTTNSILWFDARLFVCRNISLQPTRRGLNRMLVMRTSWGCKLLGMNAFITATASILNTGRIKPIMGKIGENRSWIRRANFETQGQRTIVISTQMSEMRKLVSQQQESLFNFRHAHSTHFDCAGVFDISADRNLLPRAALRSFAIMWKCPLLWSPAIVCDQRSSAITWELGLIAKVPAFTRFSIYTGLVAQSTQNTSRAVTNTAYPLACL